MTDCLPLEEVGLKCKDAGTWGFRSSSSDRLLPKRAEKSLQAAEHQLSWPQKACEQGSSRFK